ncbi:choice-of-anchor Q domain-containing protein [uncultured Aquimonas sp.]|uniref:DUF7452 domain-containing protein n=1 Tax=uncultured Aquimonas sp. TaxID=385483 RepID=UPI000869AA0F|nr:choice-of-anchor Q domain-containing protein [uncultured Aquimonas sp.]ODU48309.1 MAG: hypothetical protein ABS96_00270 [Xanthomonadaceae bacterium SCN 69-123]
MKRPCPALPHALAPLLALLCALPLTSQAADWQWPDTVFGGPCAGSLQACIDNAGAGDSIRIVGDEQNNPDRYTPINEDIEITRSLNLRAAPGIDAVFAPERSLRVNLGAGSHTVRLSDLSFRRGGVEVNDLSTVDGSLIDLQRLRVLELGAADQLSGACGLQVSVGGSAARQINIGDSVVARGGARAGDAFGGICVTQNFSGALNVNFFRNRVLPGSGRSGFGITAFNLVGGSSARASANRVFGPREETALYLHTRGAGSTLRAESNLIVGGSGESFALVMNVPGGTGVIVNNSLLQGQRGLAAGGLGSTQPASLRAANNLIAWQSASGVLLEAANTTNANNLLFATGGDSWTPGPGTLNVDPQVESMEYPRLRASSPAINAGSAADASGLGFDADGERRSALGVVDIGAFEANGEGAAVITTTAQTVFFNEAYVQPFPIQLLEADRLAVSAQRTLPATPASGQHLGVYRNPQSASGWSIFHQDINSTMNPGQRFHVIAPVASKTGFAHLTSAANSSGALSRIDHASLNGLSFAIAIALQRWEGAYHDVPIGLAWTSAGGGRWQLRNEDGSAMPANLSFNLMVAPLLSPNALQLSPGGQSVRELRIEHPLLDDNACAAPVVGRVDDPLDGLTVNNPQRYSLEYRAASGAGAPGRWFIVAEGSGTPTFPPNVAFNLIVDGAQAERCRAPREERIFRNGFEATTW